MPIVRVPKVGRTLTAPRPAICPVRHVHGSPLAPEWGTGSGYAGRAGHSPDRPPQPRAAMSVPNLFVADLTHDESAAGFAVRPVGDPDRPPATIPAAIYAWGDPSHRLVKTRGREGIVFQLQAFGRRPSAADSPRAGGPSGTGRPGTASAGSSSGCGSTSAGRNTGRSSTCMSRRSTLVRQWRPSRPRIRPLVCNAPAAVRLTWLPADPGRRLRAPHGRPVSTAGQPGHPAEGVRRLPRLLRPGRAEAAVERPGRHPVGPVQPGHRPGRRRRGPDVLHGRAVPARLPGQAAARRSGPTAAGPGCWPTGGTRSPSTRWPWRTGCVRSGHRTEKQVEEIADGVFDREWDLRYDDPRASVVYTMFQEVATRLHYRNLRKVAGGRCPALDRVLELVGTDEAAHGHFFRSAGDDLPGGRPGGDAGGDPAGGQHVPRCRPTACWPTAGGGCRGGARPGHLRRAGVPREVYRRSCTSSG